MLYGMDTVVPDSVTPAPESEGILGAALRIGEWKLVEGMVGKDDWYGEDPVRLTRAASVLVRFFVSFDDLSHVC